MMFEVSKLKDVNQHGQFEGKRGYIKWWAKKTELNILLGELDVTYEDIKDFLEIREDLYCIYIYPKTQELLSYLRKEINQKPINMLDGILYYKLPISSFKRSIYSIFLNNPDLWFEIDEFLDKLMIEVNVIDYNSDVQDKETDVIVDDLLRKHFYIFNMNSEYHPEMEGVVNNLSSIRSMAKENTQMYEKFLETGGEVTPFQSDYKRNIIYFGAPGTGKSYNLNKDKDDLLKDFPKNYERVTFHPDYSYANFVGTYKPVPDDDSITYEYVPGPFMRILKKAINSPDERFLLIIEEINRANVAAVFGDVFQILDRNKNNESVYPIDASEDMKTYLNQEKIILPENLYIWATMNSADQGVFPMDTAFKRRWDFKYFSINHDENLIGETHAIMDGKTIYWNDLRKEINDELLSYKVNEDKLMGPFFAFNEFMNKKIPTETFKDIFKNKIIMYLFEDAARSRRDVLFSGAKTNNYVTYSEICEAFDQKGMEIFCDNIGKELLDED
ncbi:MAG: AAA family ATPase [Methanobrevibacter sp.]|nr:AAA family ATPase [Methanobrevibacter sp.]MBR6516105.1 AAA family ATPase [Bacilli bacterium]